jgi:hypothetical protein
LLIQNKYKRNIQAAKQLQILAKTPTKTAESQDQRRAVDLCFLGKKGLKKGLTREMQTSVSPVLLP